MTRDENLVDLETDKIVLEVPSPASGTLKEIKVEDGATVKAGDLIAILAETDDDHELIPSPTQTSLVPGQPVTQEIVDAWMATLDTLDRILEGKLLVPHWRFSKGFDLKAYFTQARETDLVLLLTGSAALPYLKDGPIADPESFAAGNHVFGDRWPNFALWFN